MSDGRHQPAVASSSGSVSNPDTDVSGADLRLRLQSELSTLRQDPDAYPSAWAAGLGVPQDIRFGSAPSGGGYRVSPTELRNWITELQVILDWANDRYRYIKIIEESHPAAPDVSSEIANWAYLDTGRLLQRSNNAIRAYATQVITLFKASLQAYQDTEQSNRDTVRRGGEGH